MHIINLEKTIIVPDNIDELMIVNLEDAINYLSRSDGILIKGKIDITGEYLCQGVKRVFADILEINQVVGYENITDKNALSMRIEDFDYINGGQKIVFNFKMKIEGWKDTPASFQTTYEGNNEQTKEDVLKDSVIIVNSKEEMNSYFEKADTMKNFNKEDIEEITAIFNKKNIESEELEIYEIKDNPSVKEEDIEQYLGYDVEDKINTKEERVIKKEIIPPVAENPIKIIKEDVKLEGNIFDSLFKKSDKSNYTKISSFHVILTGETYESIAIEHKVKLEDLKLLNREIELNEGMIIKIPTNSKLL